MPYAVGQKRSFTCARSAESAACPRTKGGGRGEGGGGCLEALVGEDVADGAEHDEAERADLAWGLR